MLALAGALPGAVRLGLVLGVHLGAVSPHAGMLMLLAPGAMFAFAFALALPPPAAAARGGRFQRALFFTLALAALAVCLRVAYVLLLFPLMAVWPYLPHGLGGATDALLIALAARPFLGIRLSRGALLRLALFGFVLTEMAVRAASPAAGYGAWQVIEALWYLPFGIALGYEASLSPPAAASAEGVDRGRLQVLRRRRARIALLAVLALPFLGAAGFSILVAVNYSGTCYGFTDAQWQCSFLEALENQFFFLLLFLWPLVLIWMAAVLALTVNFLAVRRRRDV